MIIVHYNNKKSQVWYEKTWDFDTDTGALQFAEDFDRRKQEELKAYGFCPKDVHLYLNAPAPQDE